MKPLILTFWVLCGADAGTTHYALKHGAVEVVLPAQNPFVVDGIITGEAIAGSWVLHSLNRRGHARLARVVGWTLVGIRAYAVVHNVHELRKR